MKTYTILLTVFVGAISATTYGQHEHAVKEKADASLPNMTFTHVLSQALSDPELADYKMESSIMTLKPGAVDTISHRHDCELFGYVLEGNVEIALVTKEPKRYSTGQMFYEKRNILHTYTRNPDNKAARILLIFIIKNGRAGYTAEYSREQRN